MGVSSKFIWQQGPALSALGRTAIAAMTQSVTGPPKQAPATPGPELRLSLPARSSELVKTYVEHVGGTSSAYKSMVPAHLFPQWGFGLAGKTLDGIPYPLARVMNGGCRLEIFEQLPADEELTITACLESIDDNGRRAVLHQKVRTTTPSAQQGIVAHMYPIVPLPRKKGEPKRTKKEPACVPEDAREIARWSLKADAGLDFAKLTGDFNPIHWISGYAKMFGFKNTILHGFSTMARTIESLHQALYAGVPRIRVFDARFTKPLVLPADVGVYILDDEVFVGKAPGGPAFMVATFSTDAPSHSL
jgi:acyl dehydratase